MDSNHKSKKYTKVLNEYAGICRINLRERKFIAIKVLINGYKYFVPLSSPDKRDYYNDQDGHKKVQFTRVPTIKRIFNGNPTVESYLGKLLFNNMIPVPEGEYSLVDVNGTKDQQYRYLMQAESREINRQKNRIMKNADIVYKHKLRNGNSTPLAKRTNNFVELEKRYRIYYR